MSPAHLPPQLTARQKLLLRTLTSVLSNQEATLFKLLKSMHSCMQTLTTVCYFIVWLIDPCSSLLTALLLT